MQQREQRENSDYSFCHYGLSGSLLVITLLLFNKDLKYILEFPSKNNKISI